MKELEVHRIWIRILLDRNILGYIRIRQNPDPAGSKQSGSGQLDSLPCIVVPITVGLTMHCVFFTQCQESVKSLNK